MGFVVFTGASNTGTGSPVAVSAVTIPSGSLVIVGAGESTNSATAGTVGDSTGINVYTIIPGSTVNPNGFLANGVGAVYWSILSAGISAGSITYTPAGGAGTVASGIGYMYATGQAPAPVDASVTNIATGTGTNPSVTGGKPASTNELIVGTIFTNIASGGITQPGSFAAPWGISWNSGALIVMFGGSEINLASIATTYNPTIINSTNWGASIVGFLPFVPNPSATGLASCEW